MLLARGGAQSKHSAPLDRASRESEQEMLRSAVSKVMWVGRATVFMVGLAVILALVFGIASRALGANGQAWILGQGNVATAITSLGGAGGVDGPMVRITNNDADANDTALDLRVQAGEAPMRVNSATKVASLNADRLDGLDSGAFAPKAVENWHEVGAPGEPAFTSSGWTNFGSPHTTAGFYKDPYGVVHLKGLVKWTGGGHSAQCVTPFVLPQGYRPAAREIHPSLKNDTPGRIDILTDGSVSACGGQDLNGGEWVALDGISFRAAN